MTKQEFDAARYELYTDLRVTANEMIDALAKYGLRIVPADPVAWQDKSEHDYILADSQFDRDCASAPEYRPLYADPTEN